MSSSSSASVPDTSSRSLSVNTRRHRYSFTVHVRPDKKEHVTTDAEAIAYFSDFLNVEQHDDLKYVVYQLERTQDGKPHVQGYLEIDSRKQPSGFTIPMVKKLFSREFQHVHFEGAEKNRGANRNYCMKEQSRIPGFQPFEWTNPNRPATESKRSREDGEPKKKDFMQGAWPRLISFIDEGGDIETLLDEQPPALQDTSVADGDVDETKYAEQVSRYQMKCLLIRNLPMVREYAERRIKKQMPSVRSVFIETVWGDPGTGKSTIPARRWDPNWNLQPGEQPRPGPCFSDVVYRITKANVSGGSKPILWWDGYRGQPVVVIEDFVDWLPIEDTLGMFEGHLKTGQIKGGTVVLRYVHIFITTNVDPKLWYSRSNVPIEYYDALMSRINSGRVWTLHGEDLRKNNTAVPYPPTQYFSNDALDGF